MTAQANERIEDRLLAEADLAEKALAFMGDPDLAEETREQIAMLREAAAEIEALRLREAGHLRDWQAQVAEASS